MIILDHNVPVNQAAQLRRWRIRAMHIGFQVGRPGGGFVDVARNWRNRMG